VGAANLSARLPPNVDALAANPPGKIPWSAKIAALDTLDLGILPDRIWGKHPDFFN